MESLRSVRVRQQGARARRKPCHQQGLRAGLGGRTRRRPTVHGAPWARGHSGAGPAGRRNQRISGDEISSFGQVHRSLAIFILLNRQWPHGCCARPAVDLGVVEDHAWAGTVRSARNPARSSATMGRSFPRPRFPTRGCRGRRRVRRPGRLSGRTPRAWPGTAWIGELTATGRSSSGQAGQPPALSGQTAFFRVLERILAGSEGLRVAGTRSIVGSR